MTIVIKVPSRCWACQQPLPDSDLIVVEGLKTCVDCLEKRVMVSGPGPSPVEVILVG